MKELLQVYLCWVFLVTIRHAKTEKNYKKENFEVTVFYNDNCRILTKTFSYYYHKVLLFSCDDFSSSIKGTSNKTKRSLLRWYILLMGSAESLCRSTFIFKNMIFVSLLVYSWLILLTLFHLFLGRSSFLPLFRTQFHIGLSSLFYLILLERIYKDNCFFSTVSPSIVSISTLYLTVFAVTWSCYVGLNVLPYLTIYHFQQLLALIWQRPNLRTIYLSTLHLRSSYLTSFYVLVYF